MLVGTGLNARGAVLEFGVLLPVVSSLGIFLFEPFLNLFSLRRRKYLATRKQRPQLSAKDSDLVKWTFKSADICNPRKLDEIVSLLD